MARREPIADLEDLRDDCVAVVLNSRLSFAEVFARGGPRPLTTRKWLDRETRFPQLATVRAMLRACDHELTIAPKGSERIQRLNPDGPEKVTLPVKEPRVPPAVGRLVGKLRAERQEAKMGRRLGKRGG